MKTIKYLFVFLSIWYSTEQMLLCQELIPQFEMRLYFEDALGNRDTLEIGYDPRASFDTLLPEFGEFPIMQPFDSILDVRAIHPDVFNDTTFASKRIISDAENCSSCACNGAGLDFIFVHAKYLPILITYDSSLLNSTYCHNNTILAQTMEVLLYENWWEAPLIHCMSITDEILEDFEEFYADPVCCINKAFEVQGQGWVDIPGYLILYRQGFYCQTLVDVEEVSHRVLKFYPNPTSGRLNIEGLEENQVYDIAVYNMGGQCVYAQRSVEDHFVTLSDQLPTGIYVVHITVGDKAVISRIVKF